MTSFISYRHQWIRCLAGAELQNRISIFSTQYTSQQSSLHSESVNSLSLSHVPSHFPLQIVATLLTTILLVTWIRYRKPPKFKFTGTSIFLIKVTWSLVMGLNKGVLCFLRFLLKIMRNCEITKQLWDKGWKSCFHDQIVRVERSDVICPSYQSCPWWYY